MIKKIIIALCICVALSPFILQKKFDENVLKTISHQSTLLAPEQRVTFIIDELHKHYGTTASPHFYLFNGGGAHGMLGLLHASLNEYLIIYGSPLPNSGHSGRYLLNIHDFIFRGHVTIASPVFLDGKHVPAGDATFLAWGNAHHYALEPNTWMIEYGHGFTPSAVVFMLLGVLSTGDVIGTGKLILGYATDVVKNIFH